MKSSTFSPGLKKTQKNNVGLFVIVGGWGGGGGGGGGEEEGEEEGVGKIDR